MEASKTIAAPTPVLLTHPGFGTFIVSVLILAFGFYILGPVVLIFIHSFSVGAVAAETTWGLANWRVAFSDSSLIQALWNTFLIYFAYKGIGFPIAVLIAWLLARTKVRWSYGLEFMFWISFMLPSISTTIGWTFLLDPDVGFLNRALDYIPLMGGLQFNIYSVTGIVWAHLMGNTISGAVMLLTPAFRNMDSTLEEAARLSGATKLITMIRITLPVMIPPIVVVFMLQLVRIFQSFETEQILGTPIGFYVYSTKIFQFVRFFDPPLYGAAAALASLTLVIIAVIIPLQRWLLQRRRYTTVTGQFKPGLVDLGRFQSLAFLSVVGLVALLTIIPIATLILGSFMTRVGFFQVTPVFTLTHWYDVLDDRFFMLALKNTLLLSCSTAVISPVLFSIVAYVLVRTQWRGRATLDALFWMSAAIPGMLSGLGLLWLFLGTPFLKPIYGTLYALFLVVILQGKLTSTQLFKSVYLQIGSDMEEAARVAGAGWVYTYFRVWMPLIMPTLVLIGTLNFVIAAGTTSSIILLAQRGTTTLSILALELMTRSDGVDLEAAGIVSLVIVAMTGGVAFIARKLGLPLAVRHG